MAKSNSKRKDGRVAVSIYLGVVDGKKKYKTVYGETNKIAQIKADELRAKLGKGIDITNKQNFESIADLWLKKKKVDVVDTTYKSYECSVKHLKNAFGKWNIYDIKTGDIEDLLYTLANKNHNTNKPASKKLLKEIRRCCEHIFNYAIKNRLLDYNPVTIAEIPNKAPKKEVNAIPEEQRQWIVDTPHRAQLPALMMMYCGLRKGEVLALQWNDIDFKNKTVTVNKSVKVEYNKCVIKNSTKTQAGMRTVPIPDIVIDKLSSANKKSIYMFTNTNNNFITFSNFYKIWASYMCDLDIKYGKRILDMERPCNKNKSKNDKISKFDPKKGQEKIIETFNPHQLRHTYATILYSAGVDVLTAQYLLGHKNVKTTLDIYTNLDKSKKKTSIDNLNDYLKNIG